MNIDDDMIKVICNLECIIAAETRNPNSYIGATGKVKENYRYPITYCKTKNDLDKRNFSKTSGKIYNIDPECIGTIQYSFGSNRLFIGVGLAKVLEYLEDRYDLSFNDLEMDRKMYEEDWD